MGRRHGRRRCTTWSPTRPLRLETKPLKFVLHVLNLDKYRILMDVANFVSLVVIHSKGLIRFVIIMELQVGNGSDEGI